MLLSYSELNAQQRNHLVKVFYQRELVPAEKTNFYKYFFNEDGVCEYAE